MGFNGNDYIVSIKIVREWGTYKSMGDTECNTGTYIITNLREYKLVHKIEYLNNRSSVFMVFHFCSIVDSVLVGVIDWSIFMSVYTKSLAGCLPVS